MRHCYSSQSEWCRGREASFLPFPPSGTVESPNHLRCQQRPSEELGLLPPPGSNGATSSVPLPQQYHETQLKQKVEIKSVVFKQNTKNVQVPVESDSSYQVQENLNMGE